MGERKYLNPEFVLRAPETEDGILVTCYYSGYWICPNPENARLVSYFEGQLAEGLFSKSVARRISRENLEKTEAWNP